MRFLLIGELCYQLIYSEILIDLKENGIYLELINKFL